MADGQSGGEIRRLSELSAAQWKSGIAAWLGWLFDGLEFQIYLLIAAPFVAELIGAASEKDPRVGFYSSWIQAAFLIGWALGGGFFGRIGDRLGRSRALMLTISTYALFTGVSFFAQTWWQLLIFRFLAALGIGGEWAVGATLLSETWPRHWRPWLAAVLQTAVNVGVMLAGLVVFFLAGHPRYVFLAGVVPAAGQCRFMDFAAKCRSRSNGRMLRNGRCKCRPGLRIYFGARFGGRPCSRLLVCAFSLTRGGRS